jgi:hypothetical protein
MVFSSFLPEIYLSYFALEDLNRYCSKYLDFNYSNCELYNISNRDLDKQYLNFSNILYVFNYDLYKSYNELFKEKKMETKITDIYMDNNYLAFGLIGLLFIMNILCILIINSKIGEILSFNLTPSRFTVFISELKPLINKYQKKNINLEKDYQNIILKEILQLNEKEVKNIENMTLCYKFHNFNKSFKNLKKFQKQIYFAENKNIQIITNKKKGYNKNNNKYSYFIFCCCCIKKEIKINDIKQEIKKIEQNIEKEKDKLKDNFSGCLFLTFNTEETKNKFLKKYPVFYRQKVFLNCQYFFYRLFCCCLCASDEKKKKMDLIHNINIELAPEPDDIIWENLEFRKLKKICLKIPIYFFSILLISISLGAVCASKIAQDKLAESNSLVNLNKNIYTYLLSFIMSCIIGIINFILTLILFGLTKIEKLNTQTDFQLSYSIKLTILTFCNNAIIPYIANKFWKPVDNLNFNKNILIIFLCNSFLSPILWLFNFNYRIRKCKIFCCCIEKKNKKNNNELNFNFTQKELNNLYERPQMDISFKYSYINKTLLMTLFYASIFPSGIIISLLGFIFCFFIEKYNLAYLYNKPIKLNEKICLFYCYKFKYGIIIYLLGNILLIDDYFTNKTNVYFFIGICIFILIFPIKGLFQTQYCTMYHNHSTFNKEFFKYQTDYQRLNPITKTEGILFYLKKLLQNKIINQDNFNLAKKELQSINLMDLYYHNKFHNNLNEKSILTNIDNKNKKKCNNIIDKNKKIPSSTNDKKEKKKVNFILNNNDDQFTERNKDINEIIKDSILNSFGILNTHNNNEEDENDKDSSNNALKELEINNSKVNNTVQIIENNVESNLNENNVEPNLNENNVESNLNENNNVNISNEKEKTNDEIEKTIENENEDIEKTIENDDEDIEVHNL